MDSRALTRTYRPARLHRSEKCTRTKVPPSRRGSTTNARTRSGRERRSRIERVHRIDLQRFHPRRELQVEERQAAEHRHRLIAKLLIAALREGLALDVLAL